MPLPAAARPGDGAARARPAGDRPPRHPGVSPRAAGLAPAGLSCCVAMACRALVIAVISAAACLGHAAIADAGPGIISRVARLHADRLGGLATC
jgi:hypothetical protein